MLDLSRIYNLVEKTSDFSRYKELAWTGSFNDYLSIVTENPRICRNAYQRLYDMILSYGTVDYKLMKERVVHYNFFDDPMDDGRDAVYGLDKPLQRLVGHVKSAAHGYGTERRVLLLHGPVGSAKSTIVRLLKKGIERYSRTPEGGLYTFRWQLEESGERGDHACPMHEDPMKLVPDESRKRILSELNHPMEGGYPLQVEGTLCPFCRFYYSQLLKKYHGDWSRLIEHVQVYRLPLSEKDRIGIGTFQPKDEKNQDSTELTGDVNYRKIAEYGSDSDPRAFNFDGEFHVANRGLIEFI
jgi:serine protein kinase